MLQNIVLMKINKTLLFIVVLLSCLSSQSAPRARALEAESELVEETRSAALAMYESFVRSQADRRQMWAERIVELRTLPPQQIPALYRSHTREQGESSLNVRQQQQRLQALYEEGIGTATINIQITQELLERITGSDRKGLESTFSALISGLLPALRQRAEREDIPSTIPGIMDKQSPNANEIADYTRRQRWDELAVAKILSAVVPQKRLEQIFAPLIEEPILGGHFLVMKAYILGLEEFPPLPDHYMYRMHQHNLTVSRANVIRLRERAHIAPPDQLQAQRSREESILRISLPLIMGPLQPLKELEERAIAKLAAFDQAARAKTTAQAPAAERPQPAAAAAPLPPKKKKKKKKPAVAAPLSAPTLAEEKEPSEPKKELASEVAVAQPTPIVLQASSTPPVAALAPRVPSPAAGVAAGPAAAAAAAVSESSPSSDEEEDESPLGDSLPEEAAAGPAFEHPSIPDEWQPWKAYPGKKSPPQAAAAAAAADSGEAEAEEAVPLVLKPKIRALWQTFHTQKRMGWSDFQTLVTKLGLGIKPNGGSAHRLSYPKSLRSFTKRRHFVVHEPHGVFTDLGSNTLDFVRRALKEDLGWDSTSFLDR